MIAIDTIEVGNNESLERHEKLCERCNCKFECRADDILNCECNEVVLSSPKIEMLRKKYNDCLCVNCLKDLNRDPSLIP